MTYSEMIFAMDKGVNYSNRGRKGYKKANEKWSMTITTTWTIYQVSDFCKTEKDGKNWMEWKIKEVKNRIKRNNAISAKYGDDEYIREEITSIEIARVDRMGEKHEFNVGC